MDILVGFATVLSDPWILVAIALASIVGVVIGATPGLTAAAAIAMLLPVTYHVPPLYALAFLYVIGKSGRFGGSIAAILFNTPGTSASAATQLDGYPLAVQGKAGKALKVATVSSVIGDTIGDLILIFGVAYVAQLALKLGPPEYFAIYAMAFVVIGSVIGKSMLKGLASCLLGILVALIGLDSVSGYARFTFDSFQLMNGIGLVPVMIGIFVLGEVFAQMDSMKSGQDTVLHSTAPQSAEDSQLSWMEYRPCLPVAIRSAFTGGLIGMLPGLGSAVAAFVAYATEFRRARNPEQWGKGALEGIAAPESANNAVSGPSMVPLLTLGVPGSTIGAILMGVFLIHGIEIGPTLFLTSRELIFSLFATGLLGIFCYGLIGYFGSGFVGRLIMRVPPNIIYPMIFLTAFVAAYANRSSLFDVLVMCVFGLVGYVMRKLELSTAAFVIAFVLARGAEESLRQALLLSDSGALVFFERPVALLFFALGLGSVGYRMYGLYRDKRKAAALHKTTGNAGESC
uniref:tripartite tricarboxylate transporter permease n=1 Tax=Marinobacterium profundum TaxID=1714300 RepID=UPI0008320107|nr:tripartite tricarboxylate transporter permease [Marinobacterium profundum]